jgi:flagellar hook assembly protein FlgD
MPSSGPVNLVIYDTSGREVRTLVDEILPGGRSQAVWDGRDNSGKRLPSGVYFASLTAGGMTEAHKIIMVQ